MVRFALALLLFVPEFSFAAELEQENQQVPLYDYAWEDMDTDYDAICDVAEYEAPSALMVWLRSIGGAVYVGLCSAREYVVAKWYAIQKLLSAKKGKLKHEKSP